MDCTPYLVEALRSLRPGYVYLVERQHIDELLRERQLATLALNSGDQPASGRHPVAPRRLNMVRVAEVLFVGQVVAYDRATRDLSAGVALGGIGASGTLITDLVTFSLKAGGHITKIFSVSVMELELGGGGNEPVGLALRAAIRSALNQLVQNGIHDGWWA
jgi:hypothetical protein